MKLTREQLRSLRVFNDHYFARDKGRIFIWYRAYDRISGSVAAWMVSMNGDFVDPSGHWRDYGSKSFTSFPSSKLQAFEQAKEWAGKRYGITAWARTPFGGWMEKSFVEERMRELKAQLKAKQKEQVA